MSGQATSEWTLRQAAINERLHYTQLDNIERSGFRSREYVGYGLSEIVRISRTSDGWRLTQTGIWIGCGRTLEECSKELHRLAAKEAGHSENCANGCTCK